MSIIKIFMLIAFIGHIVCYTCDRLITCTPNGRFNFADINDNNKMSKLFEGVSLKRPLISILFGFIAMAMFGCGYLALAFYIYDFNPIYTCIMIPTAIIAFAAGIPHHVFCGAIEWFYIRLNRTEEARKAIVEFFKKTSITMYIFYIGYLILAITWFVAVVSGVTELPRWCCIFNIIPLFIVLSPFKLVGTGNLCGAIMFLGLLIFI